MAYHPEEVLCQLHCLQNFNFKPSKAPADWVVEMTHARDRQLVALYQGAVTNALFCDAKNACFRFPYSLKGRIQFILLRNGQSRARGSVRLDELAGAAHPVVSKTISLEWESPTDRLQCGYHPELVLDLRTLPEPPRDHPGSVWLTSFPQSNETPAANQNALLFPDRGFSTSLWKNMLDEGNDSPMPIVPEPSNRQHLIAHKVVDLNEGQRYTAPGTPPARHSRRDDDRPFRPLAPFEPPADFPEVRERPIYNPHHSNAHHNAPTAPGHRPPRPYASPPSPRVVEPHTEAAQGDESFYYSSLDHKTSGGMYGEYQAGHHHTAKPPASPRDKTESYSVTTNPYRPYPAGAQPSIAPAVGWSGHVGAPAAQGDVTNSGRHSGKGSSSSKEKSSLRFRIFTGHKKSAPTDSDLYAAATKNEVSAVVSQDLIRKFAQRQL